MNLAGPSATERPCLSESEAVAYVEGRLVADEQARATRHIDRCDACGWLISELARATPLAETVQADGSDTDMVLVPGRRVGRYVVGDRLGGGGMGVVYAAYDPELDRNVALKVVNPDLAHDANARARLLFEARAMARLSHPGVVPIHDVHALGGGHVVLAMEMVDGLDARQWLLEARPGWREVLDVLIPAGRGLAAAHAAGIVHRDIKPSNVLVGRDRRGRLTDFGLARTQPRPDGIADDGPEIGEATPSSFATRTGVLVGTPAYMAPEQRRGQTASALSDQFSFCVVLHEAVYGASAITESQATRPSEDARAAQVSAHRVSTPGGGTRVPPWLRRILLRGLAVEPERRWPSMQALLDALDDTPRRRSRRWLIAGGAAAILAAAGGVVAIRSGDEPCTGGASDLERAWAGVDRAAALGRIAGMSPYGQVLAPLLTQQLGEHAARWLTGFREACVAHRLGAQSSELLDRRVACLEQGRLALAAVADVVRGAASPTLPETILAVRSLPDPSACSDILAVLASAPPPRELAARVASVTATLERARVYLAAGRAAEAREQGHAAAAAARALGYRPLLAQTLLTEGRAAMMLDDRAAAAPLLAESMAVGVAVGDDALAVEAWARAAWVKGTSGDDVGAALAGVEIVDAMASRNRSAAFARALLHNNLAALAFSQGRREEARRRFHDALAEARKVTGPGAVELINVRANAASVVDDPRERDALLGEAESEMARLVGADHPDALRFRMRRAMLIPTLGSARELLTPACEAYQRFHHVLSSEAALECWSELGFVTAELGDRDAGAAAMARAAALPSQRAGLADEASGYLALWHGDLDAASERFATAMAGVAKRPNEPWWQAFARGKLGLGLGRARRSAGDLPAARAALEQAVADLGDVERGHPAAVLDRRLARARAELALVLIATGQPQERVAELARAAATALRAEGARADDIAALEAAVNRR